MHVSYVKPIPGEIEDIVQAKPEDKVAFKDEWRKWRMECVLAVDDPSVKDSSTPNKNRAVPTFDLGNPPRAGEKFRCASCYRDRFKTMNFGEQVKQEGQEKCVHCGKKLEEAGWSLWFKYEDLPRYVQLRVDRMFAPKILNVLRTRWPDANVLVGESKSPDAPLPST